MFRPLSVSAIFLLACAALPAIADDAPVTMSRDELLAFIPGTEVSHVNRFGSQRRWTNGEDGKFVASTDNKKYGSALGSYNVSAPGTWRINDEGRYCVTIEWKREAENWCSHIVKGPDGQFYLGSVDPARRIEFKKP